ncbi:MAG TPA: LytTR family DNA-binding domain-containing protein [Puia sp.]|nr:LytTR family DNA-binding domain-containing protein [Puia sp.]
MTLKCLIIDDEPLAVNLLSGYISKVPGIELAGSVNSAIAAISFLQINQVDFIFLDIEMPQLNGIDFLRIMMNKPVVILTSAHRHYAMDGFDQDVVDFLLKPISFERFMKGLNKIYKSLQVFKNAQDVLLDKKEDAALHFRVDKENVKVFMKDILWIESIKDYVKIRTAEGTLKTYQRISYLEERLPASLFIRVHRSFIVAIDKITSSGADFVRIKGDKIPIGRNYKKAVQRKLIIKK